MKIKAEKVKGKEVQAGDLFSTADQSYWDSVDGNISIGEKVYIRTNTPCRKDQEDDEIYRITIIREGGNEDDRPATCYFCGKEIKRVHSVRIVESPKDHETGGIKVWVCTECEITTQEKTE